MNYENAKVLLARKETLALLEEGTIVTPFPLIEEIIDKLPVRWDNPTLKILDPAMGRGAFLFVVKNRLMQFHSEQHIVENMLFGVDIEENNVAVARAVLNPLGKYNDNLECNDSLKKEWNMKFDVVVMNPPFNDGASTRTMAGKRRSHSKQLHTYFIATALQLAQHVAIIAPLKGWFVGRGSAVKNTIVSGKMIQRIELITDCNADRLFNATVGDLGIIHINTNGVETTTILKDGVEVGVIPTGVEIRFGNSTVNSILDKLATAPSISERVVVACGPNRSQAMEFVSDNGSSQYVPIIGAASEPLNVYRTTDEVTNPNSVLYQHKDYKINSNVDYPRVGINFAGTPRKLSAMKVIPAGVVVSRNVTTITCLTQAQASQLIQVLASKLFRFVVYETHPGKNNSKQTFKHLPAVDLTRSWTDEELYAHFNLTKEEIKLIEDTIK